MRKNVFFYRGRTQFENVGDLLINKALLDVLSRYGEVFVDDIDMPKEYLTQLLSGLDKNVKQISKQKITIYKWFIFAFLCRNLFNGANKYVVGVPGHVFNLSKQKENGISLKKAASSLLQTLYKVLGTKYFTIGISLGPFSEQVKDDYRFKYQGCSFLGVRDPQSLAYAKEQLNIDNTILMPDLAWAYDVEKFHPILSDSNTSDNIIVMSFRGALVGKVRDEIYMNKLKEALLTVVDVFSGYKFILAYQVEFDKEINREIYQLLQGKIDVELKDSILSLDDAVSLYSKANYIISNRLHVLLLGLKAGSVPLALTDIANHDKLRELFNNNEMSENLLDMETLSSEDLNDQKLAALIGKDYVELRQQNFTSVIENLNKKLNND
ncbi:polysaccharide pyruvyl transferase family protein [Sinomicrobium sp. M5D2P17]